MPRAKPIKKASTPALEGSPKAPPQRPAVNRLNLFGLDTKSTRQPTERGDALVSYRAPPSIAEIEARHYQHFASAKSEQERAQAVAAFLLEAPAGSWPIADWAFDALDRWKSGLWATLESKRILLDYDPESCLQTVAAAVARPWNKKEMSSARDLRHRQQWIAANAEEFDLDLYVGLKELVVDIRKLDRQLQPMEKLGGERSRRLERIVLDEELIPEDWEIDYPWLGIRHLYDEKGPRRTASVRFRSGEDMLHQLFNGPPVRATQKLYGWLTGMPQKAVRDALAKSRKRAI